jgi:16S rRNA (adenine1518-N6/adenine1519-N6)-dimethyltransferase
MLDPRALLQKYGQRAKKSWGQNFLIDERAYREIVTACEIGADDWVIEIGAGLGTLTARLAEVAGRVVAIERDRDLAAILRTELGGDSRIELCEANALTFDYTEVARRAAPRLPVVVGNLPYQIASPILFRLLDSRRYLRTMVLMLQKEMADRIVAAPGTSEYGALSVMVRCWGEPRIVYRVRAGGFLPPPKVDSAVLCVRLFSEGRTRAYISDEVWFSKVVHAAFNPRRKTLRNTLLPLVAPERLEVAVEGMAPKIDLTRRGETLSVEEFAALAEALRA